MKLPIPNVRLIFIHTPPFAGNLVLKIILYAIADCLADEAWDKNKQNRQADQRVKLEQVGEYQYEIQQVPADY